MSAPAVGTSTSKCGLVLTSLLVTVYIGFIALVAFAPKFMSCPLIGVVSIGLVAAFAVIVLAVSLTAIYVWLRRSEEGS